MITATTGKQYPTIHELEKFTMFTNAPGAEGKRSRLTWNLRENNPRITVFTNIPNDPKNGVIYAGMNPETFFVFLELFEKTIIGANDTKYKIDSMGATRTEEGKPGEKILVSELWFGKDSNGIIWISITASGRPKIKFEFRISDYHKIYRGDGTQFSEAESSVLQALAVVRTLRNVYSSYLNAFKAPYAGSKKSDSDTKKPASGDFNKAVNEFEDLQF